MHIQLVFNLVPVGSFVLVDQLLPSLRIQAIPHTQQRFRYSLTRADHRFEYRDRYGPDHCLQRSLHRQRLVVIEDKRDLHYHLIVRILP